ncbi:Type 1 glutamine amidotransferase-like domain-containing protein [Paenibacillus arenosi]|uniref:Peptidase E n=1 Tax=Paenibacillus arenosi TaxID=2774142 RepID=A0ABR9AXB2_9BACL|nr:Type 1 glutamine amidotransferase-like domain-containing protein [Paenibacillus arenosi]MBD8498775.1 peptidase E [Paenibacillus arenosi]
MKQIIAMGGGGFSMEPENPLLDTYVLQQAQSKQPKICFIGTASGDADGYMQRFYKAFNRYDCIPSHLSLFNAPAGDLEDYVLDKDIIYVGGGNTRNLLVLWKEWELDLYLKRAWENGTVLSGLSAGSLCWFEEGVTDSIPGQLTKLNGLGWLRGSNCPHYDGEADRRPSYQQLILTGQLGGGRAADDGVALHYRGDELYRVVSSRPAARAYEVDVRDGQIVEMEIVPDYLG